MENLAKSTEEMNSSHQSTFNIDNLKTYIGLFTYTHESFQHNYKEDIKIYLDFIKKLESAYGAGVNILGGKGTFSGFEDVEVGDLEVSVQYGSKVLQLPFQIKLNEFIAERYPGTEQS